MSSLNFDERFKNANIFEGIVRVKSVDQITGFPTLLGDAELTPFCQRDIAVFPEFISADQMTLMVEVIVERGVNRDELLQTVRSSEFQHRAFSSSKRLVRICSPIVHPTIGALQARAGEIFQCGTIGSKLISNDNFWAAKPLHGFAQELLEQPCGPCV